jgi:outer membrane receptor for ferrienterochelin and colicin
MADSSSDKQILELLSKELAALGQLEVYTASRELTSIEEAPSVVTVITAEEIRQRGYRSLKEVLHRVPGFFNSTDTSLSLIANRGYTQNPNSNYLLLIDGHSINSVGDLGLGNNHMLPFLYQVKRIEVIRGPGSTLWGGDAANGIIHLITYDGKDLVENGEPFSQVSFDFEGSRPRHIVNGLFGTELGDEGDLMVSLTHAETHGGFLDANKESSSGLVFDSGVDYKYEEFDPSYELQAKINWRNFKLGARSFHHASFLGTKKDRRSDNTRPFDFDFLELSYSPELTEDFSLDTDVYQNWISLKSPLKNNGTLASEREASYTEFGLNTILNYSGFTDHRLKSGVQWQRRDFEGKTSVTAGSTPFFVTPVGIENAVGVFAEDEYSGIEDWRFTLGMRYQRNDFRQAGSNLLWRGAAIWSFNDNWTFKYMYNTGVVRATLDRSRGTLEDPLIIGNFGEVGPAKPQLSIAQDIQAMYSDGSTRGSLTLFKQDIKQFIARLDPFLTEDTIHRQVNLSESGKLTWVI